MPHAVAKTHDSHVVLQPDVAIAAIAERQHGVISRAQLRELGLGRGAIEHRRRRRRLHRVEPNVYAVGHPVLGREGRWMSAVLTAGADAVLSHWSAASLWQLIPTTGPRTHVSVPRKRRSSATVAIHYARLPVDEVSERERIPVTSPARVMLDLAPHLSMPSLHRMFEAAEKLRPWCGPSIPELLERYPRRAGTANLNRVFATPLAMTRSEVEARFLYLLDAWDLPRPRTNLTILGFEVDCVWPGRRLIVELDAFHTHGSSAAFERDRRRDRVLQAAGWTVIRITALQLVEEPVAVRADLARWLGA